MNVKQLKEILDKYPDDLEILYCLFSDYEPLDESDIYEIKAVPKGVGGYVMRSHPTMSEANKKAEKSYLLFPGN